MADEPEKPDPAILRALKSDPLTRLEFREVMGEISGEVTGAASLAKLLPAGIADAAAKTAQATPFTEAVTLPASPVLAKLLAALEEQSGKISDIGYGDDRFKDLGIGFLNVIKRFQKYGHGERLESEKNKFLKMLRAWGQRRGEQSAEIVSLYDKYEELVAQTKANPQATEETRALSALMDMLHKDNQWLNNTPDGGKADDKAWRTVRERQENAITQLTGPAAEDCDDATLYNVIHSMFNNVHWSDEVKSDNFRAFIPNPFVDAREEFSDIPDRVLYLARRFIDKKNPSYVTGDSLHGDIGKVFGENWEKTLQGAFDEGFYKIVKPLEKQENKTHSENKPEQEKDADFKRTNWERFVKRHSIDKPGTDHFNPGGKGYSLGD